MGVNGLVHILPGAKLEPEDRCASVDAASAENTGEPTASWGPWPTEGAFTRSPARQAPSQRCHEAGVRLLGVLQSGSRVSVTGWVSATRLPLPCSCFGHRVSD